MFSFWKQLWCGLSDHHRYVKSQTFEGYYTCRLCQHRMKVTEED